jgi:hypothetical protein
MTEHGRARLRHIFVVCLLVASVLVIVAARLGPTALERCLDAGVAAGWNGTGSELHAECAEQVAP